MYWIVDLPGKTIKLRRTDMGIDRDDFENNIKKFNFKSFFFIRTNITSSNYIINFMLSLNRCNVMNITGDSSPHEDDVVDTNGRLDPQRSSFVKVNLNMKSWKYS
jgi:hypothetical protein